jgi:pentatricopeptide repeat protein
MPNEITFLSVLSSCVHIGDVEKAHLCFKMMQKYGIKPDLKHYTSMVHFLRRAGQLNEAFDLIQTMPVQPALFVWSALINGCITGFNLELGEIAGSKLIDLEEDNMANYILFANLARIRSLIGEKGMHKNPGCSWIEIRESVHMFLAHEKS